MTPGFFETLGAQMVMGRPITEDDTANTRPVAVVNEAFAKKFFRGQNPIGQHFGRIRRRMRGCTRLSALSRTSAT